MEIGIVIQKHNFPSSCSSVSHGLHAGIIRRLSGKSKSHETLIRGRLQCCEWRQLHGSQPRCNLELYTVTQEAMDKRESMPALQWHSAEISPAYCLWTASLKWANPFLARLLGWNKTVLTTIILFHPTLCLTTPLTAYFLVFLPSFSSFPFLGPY